jgi:aspartate/methionine/tyrosine aminotransferase
MTAMTRRETGPRPRLNRRLAEFGTTIFAEMPALALRTGSINLDQGFPNTDGAEEVREAAVKALREGRGDQYPPGPGVPELRTAIAGHQQRWYGLSYDPDTEVPVTAGAIAAIARRAGPARRHRRGLRTSRLRRRASPDCVLPGMRERTITISSAGKTFSFTGWKVGWIKPFSPAYFLAC